MATSCGTDKVEKDRHVAAGNTLKCKVDEDLEGYRKLRNHHPEELFDFNLRDFSGIPQRIHVIQSELTTEIVKIHEDVICAKMVSKEIVNVTSVLMLEPKRMTPWKNFDFDLTLMLMNAKGPVILRTASLELATDKDNGNVAVIARGEVVMKHSFFRMPRGVTFALENKGTEDAKIWCNASVTEKESVGFRLFYAHDDDNVLASSVYPTQLEEEKLQPSHDDSSSISSDSKPEDDSWKEHPSVISFYTLKRKRKDVSEEDSAYKMDCTSSAPLGHSDREKINSDSGIFADQANFSLTDDDSNSDGMLPKTDAEEPKRKKAKMSLLSKLSEKHKCTVT